MSVEIATPTKCRICGQTFYGPVKGLGGKMKAGDRFGPRFMHFVSELLAHITTKHKDLGRHVAEKAAEYQGWMLMQNFLTDDKEVLEQRDYFRWTAHQETLKARAENITARAQEVADSFISEHLEIFDGQLNETRLVTLRESLAAEITAVLVELREILEEPDAYKPAPVAEIPENGPQSVA